MLSLFPLDVLDEIWDVIESVSEGFLTYFCAGECLPRLFYVRCCSILCVFVLTLSCVQFVWFDKGN